jgi:hypothetical protein
VAEEQRRDTLIPDTYRASKTRVNALMRAVPEWPHSVIPGEVRRAPSD